VNIEDAEGEIEELNSEETYTALCNTAETEADGEDLDIMDYAAWVAGSWTLCTADTGCDDDEVCATYTIDTATGDACTAIDDGDCNEDFEIYSSTNEMEVVCSSERFYVETWKLDNTE